MFRTKSLKIWVVANHYLFSREY